MKRRVIVLALLTVLTGLLFASGNSFAACPETKPGHIATTGVVASHDPNALTGPTGYGLGNYVQYGAILPYRIDFENDAAATAPAQQVDITNDLDSNLDWSTFEITEIGFGDTLVPIPQASATFETTVPVTDQNVIFEVRIKAGIDAATGEVYAHFYSIDPDTGLPPMETGFLPPEDGSGRGMGHISYIILKVG